MTRWMRVVGLLMGGVVRAQAGYSVVGVAESSDDGHVAANTLDGDISTRWSALTDIKAPPPPITATTVSSTTTTTLTGSTKFPSQVLDLQNWKLTLPIDANGDGKADEIVQPQLASFILVPPFSVSDGGTGVVFWANCGGATTSGSGYPRSELREMNGGTVAAWGTADGHVHTMT